MSMLKLLLLVLISTQLANCTPITLFGGVTGSGATLSKEKTLGSSVDDYNIWTKIKASFLQHHKEIDGILTSVSVEVSEGRVLLTGTVPTAENRLEVLKLVWEQAGVREVINEIKLTDEVDAGIKKYGSDTWITTQVKSKMLLNKEVRSINYNIETINGTVYILGIAKTETEAEAIKDIVENIKGVDKFTSYIRIKTQKDIKEAGKVQAVESKEEKQILSDGEEIDQTTMEPAANEKPKESNPVNSTENHKDEEIEIEYIDSEDDVQ